jgi:hypothetical protein
MDLYNANIDKMQKAFQDILGKISFTLDVWTSPSTKSFLAITAHYIDKDWKLRNVLVDFIQIFGKNFLINCPIFYFKNLLILVKLGKHSGETIKNAFMLGLNNLSIQNKVNFILYYYKL